MRQSRLRQSRDREAAVGVRTFLDRHGTVKYQRLFQASSQGHNEDVGHAPVPALEGALEAERIPKAGCGWSAVAAAVFAAAFVPVSAALAAENAAAAAAAG